MKQITVKKDLFLISITLILLIGFTACSNQAKILERKFFSQKLDISGSVQGPSQFKYQEQFYSLMTESDIKFKAKEMLLKRGGLFWSNSAFDPRGCAFQTYLFNHKNRIFRRGYCSLLSFTLPFDISEKKLLAELSLYKADKSLEKLSLPVARILHQSGFVYYLLVPVSPLLHVDKIQIKIDFELEGMRAGWLFDFPVAKSEFLKQDIIFSPVKSRQMTKKETKSNWKKEKDFRQQLRSKFDYNEYLSRGYYYPLNGKGQITSDFAFTRRYLNQQRQLISTQVHKGLDYRAAYGTSIQASAAGKVVFSGEGAYYGKYVILSHGYGCFSHYMHLSRILVSTGDILEAGQVLGEAGASGAATGPHLHWELRVLNQPVHPESLIGMEKWLKLDRLFEGAKVKP